MVLDSSEYDYAYFDGIKAQKDGLSPHPAGYSETRLYPQIEKFLIERLQNLKPQLYVGKKALELGCAKGFVVHLLREQYGIDAYGIDVSSYAISEASPDVVEYLTQGDVRTDLTYYGNKEFDLVYSLGIWSCLTDSEQAAVQNMVQRICKLQVHWVWLPRYFDITQWYNLKPLSYWTGFFPNKTRIIDYKSGEATVV